MRNPTLAPSELNASPVYLTTAAIDSAISNSDLETVNKRAESYLCDGANSADEFARPGVATLVFADLDESGAGGFAQKIT